MQKLEFIYKFGSQDTFTIWEVLNAEVPELKRANTLSFYGKKIKPIKLSKALKLKKISSFSIESKNFFMDMAVVANHNHINLQVVTKTSCELKWWSEWVHKLVKLEGFIQAWLVDFDFDYWQNAKDPIEYESKGKSYSGLPMKSNGLPPPLDQFEIDTSQNLGLRKLCDGYVEAIGAHMWVSEYFLNLINKDIEYIKRFPGVFADMVSPSIFHLYCSVELFEDFTTQREQKNLRQALYS